MALQVQKLSGHPLQKWFMNSEMFFSKLHWGLEVYTSQDRCMRYTQYSLGNFASKHEVEFLRPVFTLLLDFSSLVGDGSFKGGRKAHRNKTDEYSGRVERCLGLFRYFSLLSLEEVDSQRKFGRYFRVTKS